MTSEQHPPSTLDASGPEGAPNPSSPRAAGAAPGPGARGKLGWILGGAAIALVAFALGRGGTEPPPKVEGPEMPQADGNGLILSAAVRERLGIRTAPAQERDVTPVVRVAGTVTYDPQYVAAVGTRLKGLVRSVRRFEGDVVKSGDLLADIDSPELGSAQASVLAYRAQKRAAELNLKREQDLASRGLTTAREVEMASAELEEYSSKLIAAEQQVSALGGGVVPADGAGPIGVHQLRAPLAGTVVERHVNSGQSVEGHLTAFRIANLDHLWVELAMFERHLRDIHKGDAVDLAPLSAQDDRTQGVVAHVGEQVDPATRTATVRVEVDNRARKLRPGQAVTAKVNLSQATTGKTLVVPPPSVIFVDGKPTVFVAETESRFVATAVTLGDSDGQHQEIEAGLKPGQHIVTEGVFALKSELFR